jgi:Predicted periplasmic protein (DUF2092)
MHLTFRRFVLLTACGGLLAMLLQTQATADDLTAKQIVERMAKEYAQCKSYRDSGVVKTVFIGTDRQRTVEKPFTTAFVRPDRFRFEYKDDKERRYIVWRDGKDVQTWWDVTPGIKKPASLRSALAAATGVSSGSAHAVPALLIPDEVGGRRLTGITEAKRIEDAKLDKVDCFRIQGQYGGYPRTLWVDKKTFLVRRIDLERKLGVDFRTERTWIYEPVIDGEISDKMLEFNLPRPH